MATVTFRLKTSNEFNTIYLRLRVGRTTDLEIAIDDYKCPKDRWSATKQQILPTSLLNYIELNDKLSSIKSHLLKIVNSNIDDKITFTNKWLRNEVFTFLNLYNRTEKDLFKIYIVDFFSYYKSEILPFEKSRDGISLLTAQTIKNFTSAFNKYQKFENDVVSYKIKLKDFSNEDLEDYKSFLISSESLSIETTNKYIKTFLSVLESARVRGFFKNNIEYKKIPKKSNAENYPYLTFKEIDKIISLDLSGYLDNSRDWLVIGCETGLRVSDLLELNSTHVVDDELLKVYTKKTKEFVTIPISKRIKNILSKHKGFPRKISSQKFNEYIKLVCKEADISQMIKGDKLTDIKQSDGKIIKRKVYGTYPKYKLISSHTCRRSFATNWYKTGLIPNHVIMAITGHKTETVFMNYIKMTNQEKVSEFKIAMEDIGR